MSEAVRATPFHARAAAMNRRNAWTERGGFTLARVYTDAADEALAARSAAILCDMSWQRGFWITGARAAEMLSRLVTRNAQALAKFTTAGILWLDDAGLVRGQGTLWREEEDVFFLTAPNLDSPWFEAAAKLFAVTLTPAEDGAALALRGPYARAIAQAAGLALPDEAGTFTHTDWQGFGVRALAGTDGYLFRCAPGDAELAWERLMKAGAPHALVPAGVTAQDILDMENGNLAAPLGGALPDALGLACAIEDEHRLFNGRSAWSAARGNAHRVLMGLDLAGSDVWLPAPGSVLWQRNARVGHIAASVFSPAMRAPIALAEIDARQAMPGTVLNINVIDAAGAPSRRAVTVVARPFLAMPEFV